MEDGGKDDISKELCLFRLEGVHLQENQNFVDHRRYPRLGALLKGTLSGKITEKDKELVITVNSLGTYTLHSKQTSKLAMMQSDFLMNVKRLT